MKKEIKTKSFIKKLEVIKMNIKRNYEINCDIYIEINKLKIKYLNKNFIEIKINLDGVINKIWINYVNKKTGLYKEYVVFLKNKTYFLDKESEYLNNDLIDLFNSINDIFFEEDVIDKVINF